MTLSPSTLGKMDPSVSLTIVIFVSRECLGLFKRVASFTERSAVAVAVGAVGVGAEDLDVNTASSAWSSPLSSSSSLSPSLSDPFAFAFRFAFASAAFAASCFAVAAIFINICSIVFSCATISCLIRCRSSFERTRRHNRAISASFGRRFGYIVSIP